MINKNFSITYKGVTYKVLYTTKNNMGMLYVNGKELCTFDGYEHLLSNDSELYNSIYDCIGGWVEGYERYSLIENIGEWNQNPFNNK
jgi:hypothetical protein